MAIYHSSKCNMFLTLAQRLSRPVSVQRLTHRDVLESSIPSHLATRRHPGDLPSVGSRLGRRRRRRPNLDPRCFNSPFMLCKQALWGRTNVSLQRDPPMVTVIRGEIQPPLSMDQSSICSHPRWLSPQRHGFQIRIFHFVRREKGELPKVNLVYFYGK